MAKILVIDDDASVNDLVARMLRSAGHDVRTASDGAAALRMLEEQSADIVVTDIYMPGMDGIEFTIRLGRLKVKPRLIAMSGGGYRDKGDLLQMAESLGAARTLTKPFELEALLAAVTEVLGSGK